MNGHSKKLQAIRLAEKRDLRIIQHQSASTDPERSLV